MEFLSEFYHAFSWRQPLWLWALILPFIGSGYQAWWLRRQQTDYAETQFWPWVLASNTRHTAGWALFNIGGLGVAWLCLVLALAGPRIEQQLPQADQRAGVDVLVLLDTSRSMSATDVSPSRFGLAQQVIESLSRRLAEADRIGLIAYAGQTHWVTPLTEDRLLFNRALHLISAEFLPVAGSQIFDALHFAQQQLAAVKRAPAMILLVTDGGGLNTPQLTDSAAFITALKTQNIALNLLGVGTTTNTMLADVVHPSGWLHDNNQPVTVPLARSELQAMAQQVGGKYLDANTDLSLIENLLGEIKNLAEPLETNQTYTEYQDFSPWLMGLALLILVWRLGFSLTGFSPWRVKSRHSTTSMLIILIFSGVLSDQAWSQSTPSSQTLEIRAYQAFEQANFSEAETLYRELGGFMGQLGAGNAAYRQTQYERALVWYRQALLQAHDDQQRAQALFNLGNSYMQVGLAAFAVEAYADAQTYQSPFEKAAHNQALAQAELTQQLAELQAQAEREAAEAERKGEGSRKHLEGSFHGGQKPDPNNSAGSGAEGESDDGRSDGVAQTIPTERFQGLLNPAQVGEWGLTHTRESAVAMQNWAQQRKLEQLEQQLQNLADDQQGLLKHLFEREAGFQAKQEQVRVIPGVEPW